MSWCPSRPASSSQTGSDRSRSRCTPTLDLHTRFTTNRNVDASSKISRGGSRRVGDRSAYAAAGVRTTGHEMKHESAWQDHVEAWGSYLRAQRKLANLSLRQLADSAKISNPYLSQLERGMHEPSVRVVHALAHALNVPPEEQKTNLAMTRRATMRVRRPRSGATHTSAMLRSRRSWLCIEVTGTRTTTLRNCVHVFA
ncbi:MAG: helix-turn-helix transcriptional regulator [Actinobacteria bacterium]|nr:MAG: helix-turn-helix transcriptional regulator [Actinomycetota bacterium]